MEVEAVGRRTHILSVGLPGFLQRGAESEFHARFLPHIRFHNRFPRLPRFPLNYAQNAIFFDCFLHGLKGTFGKVDLLCESD